MHQERPAVRDAVNRIVGATDEAPIVRRGARSRGPRTLPAIYRIP